MKTLPSLWKCNIHRSDICCELNIVPVTHERYFAKIRCHFFNASPGNVYRESCSCVELK